MPYIEQKDRDEIFCPHNNDEYPDIKIYNTINLENINKAGELNYAITEIMIDYLNRKGVSYTNMNEVVGVLECAKLELYRRMTAPYEDQKIIENGDVYD